MQDEPRDETQTDSQLSVAEFNVDVTDLCNTSSPVPQDVIPLSTPPPDEACQNEIIIAAIQFLGSLVVDEAKNYNLHCFIEEAVTYLTSFLDEMLSSCFVSLDHRMCIVELLSPSLMDRLFQLRAVFRGIAAQEQPRAGTKITIISWVDDLMVKICACILHLATNGAMQDFNRIAGTQSIKALQEHEARKAATQLPIKFSELPDTLISKYSSPAMAKMALTLLYGTTVLRERYQPDDKPTNALDISAMTSVIAACIIKYGADSYSPSPTYSLTLAEYTILASLYTYGVCQETDASFVPHTELNVVTLVELILDHVTSDLKGSCGTTPGLSTVLVEDLNLVEWFWKRWGDGSTLLAAVGLKLTRHWIQYYKYGVIDRNQACVDTLLSLSPWSFQAILHLIESPIAEASTVPLPSSEELSIAELVCEAYTALATTRQRDDLRYDLILAEACKRLCLYMLARSMEDQVLPIHRSLLGLVTSVGPTTIRAAYGNAQDTQSAGKELGVVSKVMQEVMMTIDKTEPGSEDHAPSRTAIDAERLKYMLDFLAIFLHANTSAASAIILNPTFIPKLISWASRPWNERSVFECARWNMLQTSVLLLLGFAYTHFKTCLSTDRFPEHEQDTFLDVILDNEGGELLQTCALARYMIATEDVRILDDPMMVLETWSQIRNALLATLQRRSIAEQEAISAATSGTLCAPLVSILRTVGKQTRAVILASPWTQTLRAELEKALARSGHLDDFALSLRRQIEQPATAFSHLMDRGAEKAVLEDSIHLACVDVGKWLQLVPMFVARPSQ